MSGDPLGPLAPEEVLDLVVNAPKGVPFTVSEEMARRIAEEYGLELRKRGIEKPRTSPTNRGDVFKYPDPEDGELEHTVRLEIEFPNRYVLYHGEWEPDPRWTGD